jgi:23S rRNA pseudouridine2604 synthase
VVAACPFRGGISFLFMSRTTLKLTKPVDPAGAPKAQSTRARDAQRRRHGALPSAATPLPPSPAAAPKGRSAPPKGGKPYGKPAAKAGRPQGRPPSTTGGKAYPKPPGKGERSYAGSAEPKGDRSYAKSPAPKGERSYEKSAAPKADRAHAKPAPRLVPDRPAAAAPVERAARPAPPAKPAHENPDDPRLSKLMSERGLCSRREADEWIENKWVRVDGKVVDQLGVRVPREAKIEVDPAARRAQRELVTILLNKPMGYVSGQPEDGHEPAMVLLKPENHWAEDDTGITFKHTHLRGLAPAGRLDIDSTGLIVFTQDGRVAKRLIGADSEVEKEYLVRVEGQLTEEGMKLLHHGLELDGVKLKPARVSWANEDQLRFVLREGRKRQIRRMCELVGLTVTALKRVRSGGVPLGKLPVGQWRYLRRDEKF